MDLLASSLALWPSLASLIEDDDHFDPPDGPLALHCAVPRDFEFSVLCSFLALVAEVSHYDKPAGTGL